MGYDDAIRLIQAAAREGVTPRYMEGDQLSAVPSELSSRTTLRTATPVYVPLA